MSEDRPARHSFPVSWDDVPSRREFDLLQGEMRGLMRRLDEIDNSGTRGAGVMNQKILELTSDVARLEARYEQAQRDRAANRRWVIGLTFTVIGAVVAVLSLLATVLQNGGSLHH